LGPKAPLEWLVNLVKMARMANLVARGCGAIVVLKAPVESLVHQVRKV